MLQRCLARKERTVAASAKAAFAVPRSVDAVVGQAGSEKGHGLFVPSTRGTLGVLHCRTTIIAQLLLVVRLSFFRTACQE